MLSLLNNVDNTADADKPVSTAQAAAVYLHVSSSFKREEELLAAVADGSITAEMLEDGWLV